MHRLPYGRGSVSPRPIFKRFADFRLRWANSWQAETPAPLVAKPLWLSVGQALSPANPGVFQGA